MNLELIEQNVKKIIQSLPENVLVLAAAKTRTAEEVEAAIRGGITTVGYNYVQEAERIYASIGNKIRWHMIGHLQRNKVKKAVKLFDTIETIDSVALAETVNRHCALLGKQMPVFIEVNSGYEANKSGVVPEEVHSLITEICELPNIKIIGLMTMAPYLEDAEATRPYFKATKMLFEEIKRAQIPNVQMRYLSMGMSHSFRIAIEEGANIVRIGTLLFGARY